MNNILFIVNEFDSANGICCSSVMKACAKSGYNVLCLTEHSSHYSDDTVNFFYVTPRFYQCVFTFLKKVKYGRPLLNGINIFLNKFLLMLAVPIWPLVSPLYSYRLYKKTLNLCLKEKIDIVVPIYTQIDTLIAAHFVKKRIPEIKYIPYFLDALSGGYGPRCFSKEWTIRRGLKWERILLNNADKIIAMESSRRHHELYSINEPYFNQFVFLDLPLFNLNVTKSDKSGDCLTIAYVGTLPKGIRSPQFIVNVLSKIKLNKFRFVFVGEKNNRILNMISAVDKRFVIVGRISHNEANEKIRQADVLINIGNTNENMTPCKIFEYMSMGKKIISTYPIENEPSLFYLRNYTKSLLLDEKRCDYDRLADEVVSFAYKEDDDFDVESLKKVFFKNTPQAFVSVLNEM